MYRAWQEKLNTLVRDEGHKAEIYKYLWMLMTEGDPTVFQNSLKAFQTFWTKTEADFMSYFNDYYAKRVGKQTKSHYTLYSKVIVSLLSCA